MNESSVEQPLRYPWHARLLILASWGFYACVLLILSLFMLPIVPLAPVFVMIMVGMGGLLSSVHQYARSVAVPYAAAPERATGRASSSLALGAAPPVGR